MFGLGPATKVYLALGATDMRKGFEGLYGLVRDRLMCEPISGHLFLFCNARRNRLKIQFFTGTQLVCGFVQNVSSEVGSAGRRYPVSMKPKCS